MSTTSNSAPAIQPPFLVMASAASGLSWALESLALLGYDTTYTHDWSTLDPTQFTFEGKQQPKALVLGYQGPVEAHHHLPIWISAHRQQVPTLKVLRLTSHSEALLQRYTMDLDVLGDGVTGDLQGFVSQEQLFFQALKSQCDYHLDVSTFTPTDLHVKLATLVGTPIEAPPFTLTILSFGFKYGVPPESELVFDARLLPNPFYDPALRPYTGLDSCVKEFVFNHPQSQTFLEHVQSLVLFSLPHYQAQGKPKLTVAIGCTGGQHRSVAMVMALAAYVQSQRPEVVLKVYHREMNHWPPHVPSATVSAP